MERYTELLDTFYEKLSEKKVEKISIPPPQVTYANTYTTVINFQEMCDKIMQDPRIVGEYIFKESGYRKWSVNDAGQLILKGRTTERNIMVVMKKYILGIMCSNCHSIDTKVAKISGVKQKKCKSCHWQSVM